MTVRQAAVKIAVEIHGMRDWEVTEDEMNDVVARTMDIIHKAIQTAAAKKAARKVGNE